MILPILTTTIIQTSVMSFPYFACPVAVATLSIIAVPRLLANGPGGTVPPDWHPQFATGPFDFTPLLSSRPTATHVLFLDFDGASIAASATKDWNCGVAFTVQHSGLTAAVMREIYEDVKEDYLPFNVDVTTDESRYLGAPLRQRMRCIITPTDAWLWTSENLDPKGGRSHTSSYRLAGISKAADVPCFAFITSFDANGKTLENGHIIAGAVSHELGHTLGLDHDGTTVDPGGYFNGHGPAAGGLPFLWSPIMGKHRSLLTQWCNGEYATYASTQVSPDPANINPKDDLAIIASTGLNGNGFGYAADDHGSMQATASPISTGGNSMAANGVIGRGPTGTEDEDWFQFIITSNGVLTLLINPAEPFSDSDPYVRMKRNVGTANLNPRVDLYRQNASLTTLVSASGSNDVSLPAGYTPTQELKLAEALRVRITQQVTPGTYYLKISGAGFGDPATNGYSSYGSLGAYTIDGTIALPPVITSGGSAGGTFATQFTPYQLTATGSVTSWSGTGLPPGLKISATSGLITGVPTAAGTYNATVTATGPGGPGNRAMTFTIAAGTALADATETTGFAWSTPAGYDGWFIQTVQSKDGVDAAQSSDIDDNGAAAMETQVTGPGTISFWWRVDSELNRDSVHFLVNGVEQPGGIWNGSRLTWTQKSYTLGAGTQTLRWVYDKDESVSSGADAAWVDQIAWTGTTPTITSSSTLTVNVGQTVSYFITSSITPATYGAQLLPTGLDVNGTTGEISGRFSSPGSYAIILTASTPGGTAIKQLNVTVNATAIYTATEAALDWTTSGSGGNVWFSQTAETQDGVDALRSGAITNGQTSYLQATIYGPGTLNFWWQTDSEQDADVLEFRIDGVLQSTISGQRGWAQRSNSISGAGTHFVSWTYVKDVSNSVGLDSGFVDQVVWTPQVQLPVINSVSSLSATVGSPVYLQVTATNSPTSYAVPSGSLPSGMNFNVLGAGIIGGIPDRPGSFPIQVTATNSAGNSVPANLLITVRSSLEAWAANFGLAGSNALPGADPDQDGRVNLLEMALGDRPDFAEPGPGPVTVDPSTRRLKAVFSRIGYLDLQYDVQVTDALGTWTTIARSINGAAATNLGAFSVTEAGGNVTVLDNAAPPTKTKRYMRIKIIQL